DSHPVAEDRELVDERDVDRAEDVLEELRQLRGLRAGQLVDGVDRLPVDVGRALRALGADTAEHLRRRLRRPVLAAGVDALGREGEEEVRVGLEAASLLEDGLEHLPRRARPRRRLEDDDLALAEDAGEPDHGALDDREVGLVRERGREGDEDRLRGGKVVVTRRRVDEPLLDERGEALARDVLDVRLAAVQRGDDVLDDVENEDALSCLCERGCERYADVARADYRNVEVSLALRQAAARLATTRSAAWPAPESGGRSSGIRVAATAAASAAGS